MPKVLIFGATPAQGGIETFVLNICKVMQGLADIYLYNFSDQPLAYDDIFTKKYNIKILDVVTPSSRLGHFTRKAQYKNFFKENRFDIVHINANSPSNYDFAAAAIKTGAKVIYHSHNDNAESFVINKNSQTIIHYVRKFQKKRLAKLNIFKVAVSDNAAKWMFEKYEDVLIIPNGVDFEANRFSVKKRIDGRKKLSIESDDTVLLAASRLTKQKNYSKVLSISKQALEQKIIQKLIIVGDGIELGFIQDIIHSFPITLQQNIYLLGAQKDMQMWYSVGDLLIMPSIYEGLPYSILEAQSNGLDCFVSNAIPKQAIIDSKLMHFSDVDDSNEKWLEKLAEYKQNNKNRENGYLKALQSQYSLKKFRDIIKEIYSVN